MDKCFNKSVCRILEIAEQEMLNCHHPYVGTEHLLLALLKNNNISEICIKYNLTYKNFKKELIKVIGMASKESVNILYTPLLKIVIENASKKANKEQKELDEFYLLSSLLNEQDGIALQIVSNMGVDTESLTNEINKPSLIYQLGVSLNEKESDRVYLRDKEINEVTKYNYVVINDDLEETVDKVASIIKAEKCSVNRIEEVYLDTKEEEIHELLMEEDYINESLTNKI